MSPAIPELPRRRATEALQRYCESRIPHHLRSEMRLSVRARGNALTIVEERAPWPGAPGAAWSPLPIAQFRYNDRDGLWTLYCADRNDRWHEYMDAPPSGDIHDLIAAVDEDGTSIFWG